MKSHDSPTTAAFPESPPVTRRSAILTVLYWSTWAVVGTRCLRFDNLTLFYVWWMVLGTLWLTAARVRPAHTLTPPSRWLALLAAAVSAALLIHWSYAWFLNLTSGVRFGRGGPWSSIAFALQDVLAASLTAMALIPVLTRAPGPVSVPIFLLAALPAAVAHFGSIFLSLDEWRQHPHAAEITLFDVVTLPLIMAADATRWRTFRLSRRQASNGPWLPPSMPRWQRDYVFAIQWLATCIRALRHRCNIPTSCHNSTGRINMVSHPRRAQSSARTMRRTQPT